MVLINVLTQILEITDLENERPVIGANIVSKQLDITIQENHKTTRLDLESDLQEYFSDLKSGVNGNFMGRPSPLVNLQKSSTSASYFNLLPIAS